MIGKATFPFFATTISSIFAPKIRVWILGKTGMPEMSEMTPFGHQPTIDRNQSLDRWATSCAQAIKIG
jgi:hypothetical protein